VFGKTLTQLIKYFYTRLGYKTILFFSGPSNTYFTFYLLEHFNIRIYFTKVHVIKKIKLLNKKSC
jgi:hypothetical protein